MAFFVFAALVFATALSGAFFKPDAWYERLDKPGWTPPNWVFPVVWSILYVMIAAAGWLLWRADASSIALVFWGAQLVINAVWSWLFFGIRRMDLAFGDVMLLWLVVVLFIVTAWPVSVWAALLFVPYLVWVSTAALLNWQVWRSNPDNGAPAAE